MNIIDNFTTLDSSYVPQMAALYKSAFAGEPWNDDWSDENQLTEYIKEIACSYSSLNYGIVIDGKLIAMAIGGIHHWWEGTNYNIEEYCVSPEYQGQNVGSGLMSLIEKDIQAKGIAGIFLQTDNDKPAYNFYAKNGFVEMTKHVSFFKSV